MDAEWRTGIPALIVYSPPTNVSCSESLVSHVDCSKQDLFVVTLCTVHPQNDRVNYSSYFRVTSGKWLRQRFMGTATEGICSKPQQEVPGLVISLLMTLASVSVNCLNSARITSSAATLRSVLNQKR